MSDRTPHWFADIANDEGDPAGMWQPCFETYEGYVPDVEIWFQTEAECQEWIDANLSTSHDTAYAVALERERIAKWVEGMAGSWDDPLFEIATAIRNGVHNEQEADQ